MVRLDSVRVVHRKSGSVVFDPNPLYGKNTLSQSLRCCLMRVVLFVLSISLLIEASPIESKPII